MRKRTGEKNPVFSGGGGKLVNYILSGLSALVNEPLTMSDLLLTLARKRLGKTDLSLSKHSDDLFGFESSPAHSDILIHFYRLHHDSLIKPGQVLGGQVIGSRATIIGPPPNPDIS